MWRYRKISSSFYYRLKWFSQVNHPQLENQKNFQKIIFIFLNFIKVIKFRIFIQFFGNKIIFKLFKKFYMDIIKPNNDLRKYINKIKPDLILVPSQAQCSMDNDLIKLSKSKNIKTLFLIDNWDNLSDKSVMWNKPDYIGVWGEQTKRHAIKIQKFNKNKISTIGTPRFENYFIKREKKLPSHFKFEYILFLGTALIFDENKILRILDNFFLKYKKLTSNLKIVYRPHPWRMSKEKINIKKYKNVIIDPQVKHIYLNKTNPNKSMKFQPDLNYYASLIKNSKFVVGGLTSMLIESSIFYKHYIVTALKEKQFNNQYNSLKYMVHFKELNKLKNVLISKTSEEIKKNLLYCFYKDNKINKHLTNEKRKFFLYHDKKTYSIRLLNLVNKILTNKKLASN
tara:strand:- start:176 stop:1366 length:1191 start_codon:yes stop_codon:yes gene_type:complete